MRYEFVSENVIWYNEVSSTSLTNSFGATFDTSFDMNLSVSDTVSVVIEFTKYGATVTDSTATYSQMSWDVTANTCALDIDYSTQVIQPGKNINSDSLMTKTIGIQDIQMM